MNEIHPVTILPIAPDSDRAQACMRAYFDELDARFAEGFDPGAHNPSGDLDMAPPKGCFLVATRDGIDIGCGGLKRLDPQTVEIKRVWVAPQARGLGLARRIMDELEEFARQSGAARVVLDTNRALSEAQAMYKARGYREIARYNDNPYANHWFELML